MRRGPFRDYDFFFPGQSPDEIDGELERLGLLAPELESAVQREWRAVPAVGHPDLSHDADLQCRPMPSGNGRIWAARAP
jgi:hypothetical protein